MFANEFYQITTSQLKRILNTTDRRHVTRATGSGILLVCDGRDAMHALDVIAFSLCNARRGRLLELSFTDRSRHRVVRLRAFISVTFTAAYV